MCIFEGTEVRKYFRKYRYLEVYVVLLEVRRYCRTSVRKYGSTYVRKYGSTKVLPYLLRTSFIVCMEVPPHLCTCTVRVRKYRYFRKYTSSATFEGTFKIQHYYFRKYNVVHVYGSTFEGKLYLSARN